MAVKGGGIVYKPSQKSLFVLISAVLMDGLEEPRPVAEVLQVWAFLDLERKS
jgi:hypothetical protein